MPDQNNNTVRLNRNRLGSASFLVAILLFLLPFVEIRCNGEPFASNTGLGLALGIDYKTVDLNFFEDELQGSTSKTEKQEGKLYVVALAALLLGVCCLAISLMGKDAGRYSYIAGLASALLLIALMIQLKMDLKQESKGKRGDSLENVRVTAEFTPWYFLSVLGFVAGAFLSRPKKEAVSNTPQEQ